MSWKIFAIETREREKHGERKTERERKRANRLSERATPEKKRRWDTIQIPNETKCNVFDIFNMAFFFLRVHTHTMATTLIIDWTVARSVDATHLTTKDSLSTIKHSAIKLYSIHYWMREHTATPTAVL